jgi:ribosomal protein L37AE/L43A
MNEFIQCCPECGSSQIRKRTRMMDYRCSECLWTGTDPDTRIRKRGGKTPIAVQRKEVA